MRISTSESWTNALANLQSAQERQTTANDQVSTQKVSTDLKGYGRSSEIIAAYQASKARTDSYVSVNSTVTERLNSQDLALNTTAQSATDAKDSILSAISSNNASDLMEQLQGAFSTALSGLNYEHNGQYLFAGGNNDTPPVSVSAMSQLSGVANGAAVFTNGNDKKASRIDANTTLQTGMLASDLGTKLMDLFKSVQDVDNGTSSDPNAPAGPFADPLTDDQKTYLTDLSQQFSALYTELTAQVALNGSYQNRVENTQKSLQGQSTSLSSLIGDRTDVDMSKAYSDLQQAQVAVQASAQVLSNLNQSSLLNLLK